jgi:hypothetical protein
LTTPIEWNILEFTQFDFPRYKEFVQHKILLWGNWTKCFLYAVTFFKEMIIKSCWRFGRLKWIFETRLIDSLDWTNEDLNLSYYVQIFVEFWWCLIHILNVKWNCSQSNVFMFVICNMVLKFSNLTMLNGLVKTYAICSFDAMYLNSMLPFLMQFLTKWQSIYRCLVHPLNIGFFHHFDSIPIVT